MSFRISGYGIADGEDPGFDRVSVYQGDDPEDLNARFDIYGAKMYDGIIFDDNIKGMYEDGSPLEFYEDGSLIQYYIDSNGDMEYNMNIGIGRRNDSLLGKTIHVELKNLGIYSSSIVFVEQEEHQKTEFITKVEGNWDFEIVLPDVSSIRDVEVGQEIEGTNFMIDRVSISPISMEITYSVIGIPEIKGHDLEIPTVLGVVLKDGTRIPNLLCGGGGSGYTDFARTAAYQYNSYYRVIDADEVAALIVLPYHKDEKTDPKVEILIPE